MFSTSYSLFSIFTIISSVSSVPEQATWFGNYDPILISQVTCSDQPPGLYLQASAIAAAGGGPLASVPISQVTEIRSGGNLYATAWSSVTGTGDVNHCLHCLQVTSGTKSVRVTVIDKKGASGVDLSSAAFDCLFAGGTAGGGNFPVDVVDLGTGPCSGGGGCSTVATTAPSPAPTTATSPTTAGSPTTAPGSPTTAPGSPTTAPGSPTTGPATGGTATPNTSPVKPGKAKKPKPGKGVPVPPAPQPQPSAKPGKDAKGKDGKDAKKGKDAKGKDPKPAKTDPKGKGKKL